MTTRNNAPKPTEKSREQLLAVNKNDSDVFNVRQARELLENGTYVAKGDELTWSRLSLILLQITHSVAKTQKPFVDAVRAVAIIMEELQVDKAAERLAEMLAEKLEPTITQLRKQSDNIDSATEGIRTAAISNTGTLEEFRDDVQGMCERLKEVAEELEEGIDQRNENSEQCTNDPTHSTGRPLTYATVAQVHVSAQHEEVMARTHDREKYILLDKAGTTDGGVADGMTEKELVAKANMAVELMGVQAEDRPGGGKIFVGAQRMIKGGVLYLMESVEAARWMRNPDVREAFLKHYGGEVEIREKGFAVILEYVPVGFQPDISATLRSVEQDNRLNDGDISSARYLKELWRRHPGQRTAFVAMTLRTAQSANRILRDGLIIEGRHVRGRKSIQEARHCMKCQGYRGGHVAANCRQIHDTCANCGGMHRSKDCKEPTDKTYCCNCKSGDHKASDRHCPTFQKECERVASKVPENRYKYFPIAGDPRTWILVKGAEEGEMRTENQITGARSNQEQRALQDGSQRVEPTERETRVRRGWDEYEDDEPIGDEDGDQEEGWQLTGRAGRGHIATPTRGGWRGGARGWQRGRGGTHGAGRGAGGRLEGAPSENRSADGRPSGTQRRLQEWWETGKEPTDNTQPSSNGQ
jgi:hypothetical protein